MRWAAETGLTGVHARPADVFDEPGSAELRSLRSLRAASYRVAHESVDPERLRTALKHWRLFRQDLPSRKARDCDTGIRGEVSVAEVSDFRGRVLASGSRYFRSRALIHRSPVATKAGAWSRRCPLWKTR